MTLEETSPTRLPTTSMPAEDNTSKTSISFVYRRPVGRRQPLLLRLLLPLRQGQRQRRDLSPRQEHVLPPGQGPDDARVSDRWASVAATSERVALEHSAPDH